MMTRTIDAYLDRLFDLLSGSGASGRRLLNETEGHLDAAVAEERAAGLDEEEAAARAIARFGSPEEVARAHVAHARLPFPVALKRLFAAAWFFSGATGAMFGLGGVLNSVFVALFGAEFVAPDAYNAVYTPQRCAELATLVPGAADCRTASIVHHVNELTGNLLVFGAVGVVLLVAFWLARHSRFLRGLTVLPSPAMVASVGAVGFGLAGFVAMGFGLTMLADGVRPGTGANLALGLAGLVGFVLFFPEAWRRLRRA